MSFSKGEVEEEQKERKEYVKNIGIEYRYGCYEVTFSIRINLLVLYRRTEPIRVTFLAITWKQLSRIFPKRTCCTKRIVSCGSSRKVATSDF
jgi:hypothetical protein